MTHKHADNHKLPDTKQTSWQLAVIQLTGVTSLPVLAASVLIRQQTSFAEAIFTIVLANIILWVIRWGIIGMGHKERKSTLDVARDYVGKFGSYFIAFLLLASTLAGLVTRRRNFDRVDFEIGITGRQF